MVFVYFGLCMEIALTIGVFVLIGVVIFGLGLLGSVLAASRREGAAQAGRIEAIASQLEANRVAGENLRESLNKNLSAGQESVNRNLQANQKTLSELNNQIGQIQGAGRQMLKLADDVRRLQDILVSPKMRGQLGEWSLENLLADILPGEAYELQHRFSDGRTVDALVRMPEYSVPVDAKFPLPSFERIGAAENDNERAKQRRQFARDVAGHIDKIASAYIRPSEGTLDFALMYIPSESVYYETIASEPGEGKNILQYSLGKKVIPVSPSVLYAYLMTIVMGLHGLQIEKQAAEIRKNLSNLGGSLEDFNDSFDLVGKHLNNAGTQYQNSQVKLDRFKDKLRQIRNIECE